MGGWSSGKPHVDLLRRAFFVGNVRFIYTLVGIRFATYDSYRQLSKHKLVRDAQANSYFIKTLYWIQTIKMQDMAERRRPC